jgi:hypothetical protein
MSQPDSPASLQGCAIRAARLGADGTPQAGPGNLYVSNQFIKLSWKAEYEAGQEFVTRNACGGLVVTFKDRDIAKRYAIGLELSVPDPELEEILTGAPMVQATSLGTPAGPTLAQGTGGSLTLLSTEQYQVTWFNGVGESLPNASPVTITLTGSNNQVTVTQPASPPATATYWRVYGRSAGLMGLLATVPITQTTWVDSGTVAPGQAVPSTNTSQATIGSMAPPLGVHPSTYNFGSSLEIWTKAIIGGNQATYLPWFHWTLPKCWLQVDERAAENADMKHPFSGLAMENPNYNAGPMNDVPVQMQPLSRAWSRYRSNDLPTNIQPGYQSAVA